MNLLVAIAVAVQAGSPSFADIEKNKHAAYRLLADFRDQMTITVKDANEPAQTLGIEQRIAKSKLRVGVTINGTKVVEGGYDGANQWVVSHVQKQFSTTKIPHQWFNDPYRPAQYPDKEPQFDMKFNNGYGVRFDCNPPLKITSDSVVKLNGSDARLVTARADVPGTNRFIEVKQWFFPDRWVLRKFEVRGQRDGGKTLNVVGEATTVQFKANNTAKDFEMPRPSGYTEVRPG